MAPADRLARLVADAPPDLLEQGALDIARIGHPDLDPAPVLRELDALADGVRADVAALDDGAERVLRLARWLFAECGFHGNQDTYYDPRNSFLNDFLARRTGIPITLSVVMIAVARRLAVAVDGVGFPGHFLVRAAVPGGMLVLDPFFGGRPLDESELLGRLAALQGAPRPDQSTLTAVPRQLLAPLAPTAILARMLRNLLQILTEQQAWPKALEAVERLLVVVPDGVDELRTRGRLYEQLGCPAAAIADYRRFLALSPDDAAAATVRRRLTGLLQKAPTLH